MKERINKLAEQAGAQFISHIFTANGNGPGLLLDDLDLEKFAELLVKECVGVAEVSFPANSHPDDRLMVKNGVLKHFGVEE